MERYLGSMFFLIAVLLSAIAAAQDESRTSLGIAGCSPSETSASATPDGGIVFIGCDGPTGVFYSREQGQTWTFAGVNGSAYEAGAGRTVFIVGAAAYMYGGSGLITTPLPASAAESWTPAWTAARNGTMFSPTGAFGDYLVGYAGPFIQVYDTKTSAIIDQEQVPPGIEGWQLRIEGLVEDRYLLASFGGRGSSASKTALYRIDFNPTTGKMDGTWQETVLMNNGAPVAAGLPSYSTPEGPLRITNIALSPHGKLYVALSMQSYQANQPIYTSTDLGASFQEEQFSGLPVPEGSPHAFLQMKIVSFAGDNYLFGSALSRDRGLTWTLLGGRKYCVPSTA